MDSTTKPSDEVKSPEVISVPKGKRKRGMSAWACAYKARNWTLESSKDSSTHKANSLMPWRHVSPNPLLGLRTLKGGGFGLTVFL
jgi:hypothetical protein